MQGRKVCDRRIDLSRVAAMDAHLEEAPAAAGARQEMHFLTISIHMRAAPRTDEANAPADKREAEGEAASEVRGILCLLALCSALVLLRSGCGGDTQAAGAAAAGAAGS